MTAPNDLTWDLDIPRRPSLDDVGGAALEDDAKKPPIPPKMPYAAQLNQWAMQIERLSAVTPVAVFTVTFSAGTPTVNSFQCMRTGMLTSDFTVTDNGNGDTTITWAANTFPTPTAQPSVSINEDLLAIPRAFTVSNGVRVKTANAAGTLIDAGFTVLVF